MQGYKRVDGPSEDELKKKHEEGRKNSPFSNPSRRISNHPGALLLYLNHCYTQAMASALGHHCQEFAPSVLI